MKVLSCAEIQCTAYLKKKKGIYIIVIVYCTVPTDLVKCICIAILFKLNNALCKWSRMTEPGLID